MEEKIEADYYRSLASHLIDGTDRPIDLISEQQEIFLNKWRSEPAFQKKIRKFSLPLCHQKAEEIIRATLHLPANTRLQDADIQKAVVSACLTPLRQSIGSCFATAPAILVQRNHLDLFVADLYELLTTGRLRRVVEGNEYTVPLSLSFENNLLKAWEFTLASFSDIKMEFSQWNLSWSLGLHPQEKGGIGEMLYTAFDQKLQETNQKIEEYHHATVEAYEQFKATETLLHRASTESEARRLKAEGQARLHHFRSCEALQIEFQERAKAYSQLFSFLINQYTRKFQEYFQEIYDPEMAALPTDIYEDRTAGFRLVYKHGRNDSSLWTFIYDAAQFIKILVEFFTATEVSIIHSCETEQEKKIVEEMTTLVIQHVQSDQFIKTAMARTAVSNRRPWSYLSGGTMDQLIPIYFRLSSPLKKESQEIHNELDLFVFLLDTLKTIPFDPSNGLLIQSPTHAFSLLPALHPFQEGWQDNGFTYTWIRDNFLIPARQFYNEMSLNREQQLEIMRRLSIHGETTPSSSIEDFSAQFNIPPDFFHHTLPLIPADQCKSVLQNLLMTDQITLPSLPRFLSSQEIQRLAGFPVAARAREIKLAPPTCIFADTNWPNSYFAFVINPCSSALEVWRTDKTGTIGSPLPLIKSWLGKGKDFIWTIYTNKL